MSITEPLLSPIGSERPIGVFDSGVGGLSILRHIQAHLPKENLLYLADSKFAPYGEKSADNVISRTRLVAQFLIEKQCKALVVACNTATAISIEMLRRTFPDIPIIGVEPGLKPASALSKTKIVGVLATARTLRSEKFQLLHQQLEKETAVQFILQACPQLADQIEKGEKNTAQTRALIEQYVSPLIKLGADTLVLGCTHYPFVQKEIHEAAVQAGADSIEIIETGEPVTRQLIRLLEQKSLTNALNTVSNSTLEFFTTGEATILTTMLKHLFQNEQTVTFVNF